MTEFTDSFSQAAIAEACSASPQLLQLLAVQLTLPVFFRPFDEECQITGAPEIKPLSSLRRTVLWVATRDLVDHLPKEITFERKQCPAMTTASPKASGSELSTAFTTTTAVTTRPTGAAIPESSCTTITPLPVNPLPGVVD